MSTSGRGNPKFRRGYVPATALAKMVKFEKGMMHVVFTDGRIVSVPLAWFPGLQGATTKQRGNYKIGGGGVSLHWPGLESRLGLQPAGQQAVEMIHGGFALDAEAARVVGPAGQAPLHFFANAEVL